MVCRCSSDSVDSRPAKLRRTLFGDSRIIMTGNPDKLPPRVLFRNTTSLPRSVVLVSVTPGTVRAACCTQALKSDVVILILAV